MEGRQVVLITGAAGGIGADLAAMFARDGYAVAAADLEADAAERVAATITRDGGIAIGVPVDVTDEERAIAMVARVQQRFGRIDVLINNAGLFGDRRWTGPVLEVDLEQWDAVMTVNVRGALLVSRAVAPTMKRARWGRIVNISSMAAHLPVGVYGASKLALNHLTWTLAVELGPHNVTVNGVGPGAIEGEASRRHNDAEARRARIASSIVKRLGRPSDVYAALRYFVSPEAGFCTGQTLLVNGGVNVVL